MRQAQAREIQTHRGPKTIAVFEGNGIRGCDQIALDLGDGLQVVGRVVLRDTGWSFAEIERNGKG